MQLLKIATFQCMCMDDNNEQYNFQGKVNVITKQRITTLEVHFTESRTITTFLPLQWKRKIQLHMQLVVLLE